MSAGEPIDREAMREMAEGCGWTFAEFAERYRAEADREMAAIDASLAARDAAGAARRAHGLAGASVMAGVPGMHEVLQRLETAARAGEFERAGELRDEAAATLRRVKDSLTRDA
jgi:HPt (histidine-containing phosphotransfer) domain-containing protein